MDTNFLTAMDIAKLLKISKALAYRLIAQGQIPSIRFGKTVRVSLDDFEKFIEQNKSSYSLEPIGNGSSSKIGQTHLKA